MSYKAKIGKYIKSPWKLFRVLGYRGFFKSIPDEKYLKILYKTELGKTLDLDNPKTFNEKLQWLKLYYRGDDFTNKVDKIEVRKYIEDKLGKEYLIPMLGIYDSVEEINWDELPNKFVLKCTHGSHCNIICKDKDSLDIEKAKKKLTKWMEKSWYWFGREWPYKNIKPRIICEEFIVDEKLSDLPDYKFMCFNGKPKLVMVCQDRNEHAVSINSFYDMNWNITEIKQGPLNVRTDEAKLLNKPKNYEKMIEFSKVLSEGLPFSRIDFYEVNGKLLFGEITFFTWSGLGKFTPEKYDEILGSWIELPKDVAIGER